MNLNHRVLIALMLSAAAAQAGVYRWVDKEGKIHYSDSPPAAGTPAQKLVPDAGPNEEVQKAARERLEQSLEQQKRRDDALNEEREKQQKDQEAAAQKAAQKEELCRAARQNLETLEMQGPVYSVDEKGARVFLDDAARPEEIARVKGEIETNCKP